MSNEAVDELVRKKVEALDNAIKMNQDICDTLTKRLKEHTEVIEDARKRRRELLKFLSEDEEGNDE